MSSETNTETDTPDDPAWTREIGRYAVVRHHAGDLRITKSGVYMEWGYLPDLTAAADRLSRALGTPITLREAADPRPGMRTWTVQRAGAWTAVMVGGDPVDWRARYATLMDFLTNPSGPEMSADAVAASAAVAAELRAGIAAGLLDQP